MGDQSLIIEIYIHCNLQECYLCDSPTLATGIDEKCDVDIALVASLQLIFYSEGGFRSIHAIGILKLVSY